MLYILCYFTIGSSNRPATPTYNPNGSPHTTLKLQIFANPNTHRGRGGVGTSDYATVDNCQSQVLSLSILVIFFLLVVMFSFGFTAICPHIMGIVYV